MLPLSLCLLLAKNYLIDSLSTFGNGGGGGRGGGGGGADGRKSSHRDVDEEEEKIAAETEESDKEDKKSLIEQYQSLKEVGVRIQEALDKVASIGEQIKNTFNWTVGFQSTLAFVVLLVVALVLYLVPLRALLLIYGLNKVR